MRHEVFHRNESSLNASEWRSIFLHWLALAWLLYFLVLAVLTAVYFAARRRIARLLWKNSFLPNPEVDDEEKVGKHAHCRRFSAVPMGDDEPDPSSLEIVQSGYRTWWYGFLLRCLWLLVPVVSQIQLAWLTWEQYFGLGWDRAAKQFLLIYVVSHLVLFLATRFSGQVKTFFLQPSSLAEATHIAIFPRDPKKGLSELELVRVRHMDEHDGHESEEGEGRFYQHTCVRYLWSSQARRFRPSGTVALSGEESYQALDRGGLPSEVAKERLAKQGSNAINVKVPGILASLLAEYSDPTYVFQLSCIWVYLFWNSWNVAALWFFLVFGTGAWTSLVILRQNQQQIADMAAASDTKPQRVLRDGKWKEIKATDLTVGDIVQVFDGMVTADIALVSGSAVVNESMLTGEPMPLQKVAMEAMSTLPFDDKIHGKKHGLFAGTEVLQSVPDAAANANRGSDYAIGVVMRIGGRTTKGKLIRMVLFPAIVKFKYTEQLPWVYALMTAWATFCFANTLMFQGQGWISGCFAGMSFLAQALNPMMAVSFTLGQSCSASRLKEGEIACLNIGRIPIAGKISTMVFDKTGTITHGGMDLAAVRPIAEGRMHDEVNSQELLSGLAGSDQKQLFLKALAGCHSVTTMRDGSFVGNQVEIVTIKALGWELSEPGQPRAVRAPDGTEELEVLRQLEFDHHRMTSGAVVRCRSSGRLLAFVKGAYDKISQIAEGPSVPPEFGDVCEGYASQCFYVLAMSWKEISAEEVMATRDTLEQGLQMCGLLLFRNEMKSDSREVIEELKLGGINCVICTGDNTTTGVSIGRQCGIIQEGAKVLIGECSESPESSGIRWRDVDAKETSATTWRREGAELALSQSAFRWLLREQREELKEMLPAVKVFGRMKPDDKIKVITLWQSYGDEGTVTGMTGDGGNDCGALRTVHAGLALSEAEASMVSPFSSSKGLTEKGFISLAAVTGLIKEGRSCLATNMATFIYFMIYNLMLTSTKLAVLTWTDSTFAEWQFILTDVGLAMVMVSFMVRCRPEAKLAPAAPSASLFGTQAVVSIFSALLIYWLTAGVALLLLQYGPGRTFYEFGSSILSEIPVNEWTKKSDNYLIATVFLVSFTVLITSGFMLCYGHVHRQSVSKNWRMCSFYALGIAFTLALTWAKPGDFSCTFRINCDTAASKRMSIPLISKPVAGVIFSCGNLGGCFLGPQMVSCKSKDGRCWIAPPSEFGLNSSWDPPAGVVQPPAPFETREQKHEYCKRHPYKSGDATDPGNKWCWRPESGSDPPGVCGPLPPRDLGPMVRGCQGPNNCFDENFKAWFTGLLVVCVCALHAMYKLGVLGAAA